MTRTDSERYAVAVEGTTGPRADAVAANGTGGQVTLMSDAPISIATPAGPVSGLWNVPAAPVATLVLGHGAGAGMRHHFMADLAAALAREGIAVLRYQFPSREAGKSRPDSPAVAAATVAAATEVARGDYPDLPLYVGGKSFGGRMSSHAAADGLLPGVRGLVFVGFPLHPPKRPATSRGDHLDRVRIPMLFLQGTRDDLADIDLIHQVVDRLGSAATLHEIPEADHAFSVPKRTGKLPADVMTELATVSARWMRR
ncbi:MAG: dienelactone hydrolase family protein [Gemmatimonadales bacterium]|nr:dienelactone hydrolase family protein [Gemmatimonadales bacterium]